MSSYGVFAGFYDALMRNVDYKKYASDINEFVRQYGGKNGGILLDLACGTGSLAEELDELGYDVIAVDNSPEMLSTAMDKKMENGRKIQYLLQDMRSLDMFGTIDVTVCTLDSLNHLDGFDDVKRVFERVYLFCEPDGLFIFDINTEYKHKVVLGEHTFIYDVDDVYCVWQNSCKNSRVKIELDFFVPEKDVYRRYSETFFENAYPLNDVKQVLEEIGFEVLSVIDSDTQKKVSDTTQRAVFIAKKLHRLVK